MRNARDTVRDEKTEVECDQESYWRGGSVSTRECVSAKREREKNQRDATQSYFEWRRERECVCACVRDVRRRVCV